MTHFRQCTTLCYTLSSSLVIRRTRLSTVGDRAFPVAAARVWNSLPQHFTSAQSLPVFHSRLKTHLFRRCFLWLCCCAWGVTSSFSDTLIVVLTYLFTYLQRCVISNSTDGELHELSWWSEEFELWVFSCWNEPTHETLPYHVVVKCVWIFQETRAKISNAYSILPLHYDY